jgi:peroxiredoxin
MTELGELEKHNDEFAARHVRLVAVSNDDHEDATAVQKDFPHLVIVSDADQNLAKAVEVIHPKAGHKGEDTNAPTTFLIDETGNVRWLYRPTRLFDRLSPEELLKAVDETWPAK